MENAHETILSSCLCLFILLSLCVVRRLNPDCGFVLLDKLEQMDMKTLREFGAWLELEGLQAIATRVSTGDECSIMPYYSGGFGGNGIFGGDIGSLFALFFIAMMFGGFGGGWGMGGFGGGYEFPWLLAANANNQNATQDGFNQAAIAGQLDGIRGDVNRGFSDTQLGIAGAVSNTLATIIW